MLIIYIRDLGQLNYIIFKIFKNKIEGARWHPFGDVPGQYDHFGELYTTISGLQLVDKL